MTSKRQRDKMDERRKARRERLKSKIPWPDEPGPPMTLEKKQAIKLLFKRRQCNVITSRGDRCKGWTLKGPGIEHCRMHANAADREINLLALAAEDAGRDIDVDPVQCKEPGCKEMAVGGYSRCRPHIGRKAKGKFEWYYNKRINKVEAKKFLTGRVKGQKKSYDGYLSNEDTAKLINVKGEVFSFYGSAFMNTEQRKIFTSAPVGVIDDDIKIIRFLVRDSLENQSLFIAAQAAGNVDRQGFVTFSKETAITEDGEGNIILSATRKIRRRQDYLGDIERLTRLLATMEKTRIDVQEAAIEQDKEIVPFHFNVLPPSPDHPTHGDDSQEEETDESQEA